jgi:hypothetical protein
VGPYLIFLFTGVCLRRAFRAHQRINRHLRAAYGTIHFTGHFSNLLIDIYYQHRSGGKVPALYLTVEIGRRRSSINKNISKDNFWWE